MKKEFEKIIWDFIQHYASDNDIDIIWQRPIVKFADAKDPHMTELKDIVIKDHYLPKDILPSAENVLSYYLPFKEEIGESNVKGRTASEMWANAYRITNQMAIGINEHLVRVVKEKGYRAAAPKDAD